MPRPNARRSSARRSSWVFASGYAGLSQLEAAIASEPVEHVGPDAATDVVAGLDHLDGAAAPSKDAGALQPGQPGTDHQYVDHPAILTVSANRFSIV
jgi:hypothetical protein